MTFNFDALKELPPPSQRGPSPEGKVELPGPGDRPDGGADGEESRTRRRALLVGQPNVGKSVLFGALTGTYVTVSNYPGTTVEITRGRARVGAHGWEVVDTPGTHNLVPMSEDEAVARDVLLAEGYDAVVQVGDAKNLTRTLLLTLQLAELGVPFCLDLNMLDEARARGLRIDLEAHERELPGVRVNASTATEGEGLEGVRAYLAAVESRPVEPGVTAPLPCGPRFPDDVEAAIDAVAQSIDGASVPAPGSAHVSPHVSRRALATMLLAGERSARGVLETQLGEEVRRLASDRASALV